MEQVILIIHLIIALVMIGLVLLQRSEGGGLGIGSSGGMGNFASRRGTTNVLTRATSICFALFVVTSLTLAIFAGQAHDSKSLIDNLDQPAGAVETAPAPVAPLSSDAPPADPAEPTPQPVVPTAPLSR